jgi:threonine/homoserine/homoserine lactone efflux protein
VLIINVVFISLNDDVLTFLIQVGLVKTETYPTVRTWIAISCCCYIIYIITSIRKYNK